LRNAREPALARAGVNVNCFQEGQNMTNSKLFVGVDGGGTNTRAVVIDENLQVLGRGAAPSSNHYAVGLDTAVANAGQAVDQAVAAAGVDATQIGFRGYGLAGACSATEKESLSRALSALAPRATTLVDEDAVAAWAGALASPAGKPSPGAVMIAGTGANCFGVNEQGQRARADGLGSLLGDRGSGYWIGQRALEAICRAQEGAGPATTLYDVILAFWKLSSIDDLVVKVYAPDFARSELAALLPLVQEQSDNDAVAAKILRDAGAELANTALAVLGRLNVDTVAITGGVLTNVSRVRDAFKAALVQGRPSARVETPHYDAAIGAALMGRL
jgi:N-acetylglucosamine kinase-like BadF-type ATPase